MAGSHEVRGSIPLCSTKYSQVIEVTRWPVCFFQSTLGATPGDRSSSNTGYAYFRIDAAGTPGYLTAS